MISPYYNSYQWNLEGIAYHLYELQMNQFMQSQYQQSLYYSPQIHPVLPHNHHVPIVSQHPVHQT